MKNRRFLIAAAAAAVSILLSICAFAGEWVKDSNGWWFRNSDGSYPSGGVYSIGDETYAFNKDGYMIADSWVESNGSWYYFTESGEAAKNQWVGDYYLDPDGQMATDAWIGDYYVDSGGKWVEGAKKETSSYSGSSSGGSGNLHDPFRDAKLGQGYESNTGSNYSSDLETKDIHRYN